MVRCPTEIDLERFLDGSATPDEAARIDTHQARCESCRAWLEEARRDEDLVPHLRRAETATGPAPPAAGDPFDPPALARYRVLRRIGAGGMGVVYEAEQQSPRRPVALKVLRGGVLGERAQRRFEAEAQVLAQLDHPGIARILEAGTYGSGDGTRPFFAMELVRGRSLVDYAAAECRRPRDRVALMALVCDAVQHAHQKGVVHRDLKPGNVLVTSAGRPVVLDFGVARTFDDDAASEPPEVVGTPPYASPEQLGGDPLGVDTRADVWALGACLYELLAGRPPFDLRGLTLAEARERILAEPPAPLGTRDARLAGDLEAIVARALAPGREDRYPSAAALGDDLRRCLADEPVAARPPRASERVRRFVRKQRALVAALVLTFVALVAGIVATASQARRARAAEAAARADAATVEEVNVFLQALLGFDSQDPLGVLHGSETTFGDILAEAEARLDERPLSDPLTEARFRVAMGAAWRRFDEVGRSVDCLRRALELREGALGPGHRLVAEASNTLGVSLFQAGDEAAARACFERALATYAALPGGGPPAETATSLGNLARIDLAAGDLDAAERHQRAALELHLRHLGPANLHVSNDHAALGGIAARRDRWEEAAEHYRASVRAARAAGLPEHPHALSGALTLATVLVDLRRAEEARELLEEVLASLDGVDGLAAERAQALHGLAVVLHRLGEAEAAEVRAREALELVESTGAGRDLTPGLLLVIGDRALGDGDFAGAEEALGRAVRIAEASGATSAARGVARAGLGVALARQGRVDEAEVALRTADRELAALARPSPYHGTVHAELARIEADRNRPSRALAAWQRALDLYDRAPPVDAARVPHAHAGRGVALLRLERYEEAVAAFDRALAGLGADRALDVCRVSRERAAALVAAGRPTAAVAAVDACLAGAAQGLERERAHLLVVRARACGALGRHDEGLRDLDAARGLLAGGEDARGHRLDLEALALRARAGRCDEALSDLDRVRDAVTSPPRDADELALLADAARCLAALGRVVEAEDVLLEALALLEEDGLGDEHRAVRAVLRAAVALYDATDRSGWAKEYRARLE